MTFPPSVDFVAAIREGREPSTTVEKPLIIQKITDAVYQCAATATSVSIG